jgi:hypothetical protein
VNLHSNEIDHASINRSLLNIAAVELMSEEDELSLNGFLFSDRSYKIKYVIYCTLLE